MSVTKEVTVKIGVDGRQAISGVEGIQAKVAGLRNSFSKIGLAAIGGAVVGAMGVALKYASDVASLGKRIDSTLSDAEKLNYAAKSMGTDVVPMLDKLKESRSKALLGSAEEQRSFQQLGINLDMLRNKSPLEIFWDIARAQEQGRLTSVNYSAALKVLGESAKDTIPQLRGMVAAAKEFDDMGLGTGENALAGAATLGKAWGKSKRKFTAVGGSLAGSVGAPIATGALDLANYLGGTAQHNLGWLGSMITSGGLQDWFKKQEEAGAAWAGGAIADRQGARALEARAAIMEQRIAERRAIAELRRKDENNAYIDDMYQQMYGAPSSASPEHPLRYEGMRIPSMRVQADSLARIGLFNGPQDRAATSFQQEHIGLLKAQVAELRAVYRTLNNEDSTASGFGASTYGSGYPVNGSSW